MTGNSNNTNIHNNQRGGVVADVMEYVGVVHSDAMRCVRAVKSKQQSTAMGYHD